MQQAPQQRLSYFLSSSEDFPMGNFGMIQSDILTFNQQYYLPGGACSWLSLLTPRLSLLTLELLHTLYSHLPQRLDLFIARNSSF